MCCLLHYALNINFKILVFLKWFVFTSLEYFVLVMSWKKIICCVKLYTSMYVVSMNVIYYSAGLVQGYQIHIRSSAKIYCKLATCSNIILNRYMNMKRMCLVLSCVCRWREKLYQDDLHLTKQRKYNLRFLCCF